MVSMRRKIISILLALALTPLGGAWALAAETADEGLVFDMDLSEYNDTDGVIKNAVTGSSDGIEIKGAANGTRPKLGTMDSMQGQTKYLSFSGLLMGVVAQQYGSVDLSAALCAPLQNQDGMTVEFWVNYLATANGTTKSSRIFNFGPESGASDSNNSYEIYVYDGDPSQYFVRYARTSMEASKYLEKRINVKENLNTWTHYVLTRQWDEEAQAYTGNVYVNGVAQGASVGGIQIPEDGFRVQIGNMAGGDILHGSLASFKLYNTALSADTVKEKYDESKLAFMTLGDNMNIVSPTQGKTLDTAPGEIEIVFDNYVDPETISGITFKKTDGTEITGGIQVYTKDEIAQTVYVKYGKLDSDSAYILDIPDTVCSLNGIRCGGAQFTYQTEGFYIFYEDFEEYTVGGKPDGDKMLYMSSGVDDSLEDVVIKEATGNTPERKKKYVSIITNAADGKESNSSASVLFDTPITYDFVVEVGVRGQNGTPLARSVRMEDSNGTYVNIADLQNGTDMGTRQQPGGDADKMDALFKDFKTSAKDEFGFIRMKFVFQKDTDGKYIVTGTCLDDENVDYRMPLIHTDCKRFLAAHQYHGANTEMCVDLSYVKIYKYSVPEIVSDNTQTLTQDSDEITMVFSEDIDPATVTENCAKLVNTKTGETVLTRVTGYDEGQRQLSVKLGEYLDYGTAYDLLITDLRTTSDVPVREGEKISFTFRDYDLTVSSLTVKDQNGAAIESLAGATALEAAAVIRNTASDAKTAKVFAVLYNQNHVRQASAMETAPVPSGGTAAIAPRIEGAVPQAGDYLEVYVWEKAENSQHVVMQDPFVINY